MQFHLNGFEPGDPAIADPAGRHAGSGACGPLPQRSRRPDRRLRAGGADAGRAIGGVSRHHDTRIVEQKPGPLQLGQADGIACRTMEMYEAFGFSERMLKEAYWVNETTFWKPDDSQPRKHRAQRPDPGRRGRPLGIPARHPEPGARARFLLEVDAQVAGARWSRIIRGVCSTSMSTRRVGDDDDAHPVTVKLERIDPAHEGEIETIKARYVVGCDGARSTVRKSIGRALHGDSANQRLGRDGRPGRHGFPRHSLQGGDLFGATKATC